MYDVIHNILWFNNPHHQQYQHPWDVTSLNEHSLIDDLLLISSTLSWQIRFWCPKLFSLGIEILIPSTCCWQNNSTPRLNFFQSLDLLSVCVPDNDEFDIPNLFSCQQAIVNHVLPSNTSRMCSRLSASKSRKTVPFRITILCSSL